MGQTIVRRTWMHMNWISMKHFVLLIILDIEKMNNCILLHNKLITSSAYQIDLGSSLQRLWIFKQNEPTFVCLLFKWLLLRKKFISHRTVTSSQDIFRYLGVYTLTTTEVAWILQDEIFVDFHCWLIFFFSITDCMLLNISHVYCP